MKKIINNSVGIISVIVFFIIIFMSPIRLCCQIHQYGVHYYIAEGRSLNRNSNITIVYFNSNKVVILGPQAIGAVLKNIHNNSNYYERRGESVLSQPNNAYSYNSSFSTSKSAVYSRPYKTSSLSSGGPYANQPPRVEYVYAGDVFVAFKNGTSIMYRWKESKNDKSPRELNQ